MKLNVSLIKQNKSSVDCGLAGISMLLKYYGINRTIQELKREIKVYPGLGTYAPQLGTYLLKRGFEVEIVTMNPYLFCNKLKRKSQKELYNFLSEKYKQSKKPKYKKPLKFFKEFIEAGGSIKVKIPDVKDIKEEISKGRPLCALITSNFLLGETPVFNFHFNVVTGIDKKYIYVNDPLWDYRGGKHKHLINDFLYAIYASAYGDLDNASLIKIKKTTK
ncbi:Peptidase_C39 like family protein [uncultured archaeon]|nr:Peptidase_C39 like family protein [uncultured archaeon]